MNFLSLPELVLSVVLGTASRERERHLVAISGAEEAAKRAPSRSWYRFGRDERVNDVNVQQAGFAETMRLNNVHDKFVPEQAAFARSSVALSNNSHDQGFDSSN
jgi:hypothetical protein